MSLRRRSGRTEPPERRKRSGGFRGDSAVIGAFAGIRRSSGLSRGFGGHRGFRGDSAVIGAFAGIRRSSGLSRGFGGHRGFRGDSAAIGAFPGIRRSSGLSRGFGGHPGFPGDSAAIGAFPGGIHGRVAAPADYRCHGTANTVTICHTSLLGLHACPRPAGTMFHRAGHSRLNAPSSRLQLIGNPPDCDNWGAWDRAFTDTGGRASRPGGWAAYGWLGGWELGGLRVARRAGGWLAAG